jgi:hypothetical protein
MKCKCPSETHGHEAGKCYNLATEPDRMCKPCHDSWADEAMPTAESDRQVLGLNDPPQLARLIVGNLPRAS